MTTDTLAEWQRGYALEELKALAGVFKAHDEGLILGAFTRFSEMHVAESLAGGRLRRWPREGHGPPVAVLDVARARQRRVLTDFAGRGFATLAAGDKYVKRIGYTESAAPGAEALLADELADGTFRVWADAFVEHPRDGALLEALGFRRVATRIKASSELVGVYLYGEAEVAPPPAADVPGLVRLVSGLEVWPLLQQVRGLQYADHYSTYNKGHSWSALALRGFGGEQEFIAKPAEMSRKWKAEHPEALEWRCEDTPLRAWLPAAEPLIAAVPGTPERIRLMRLAPGGGELERHADITDPDAGTADGMLCRVHIPLQTNPAVLFTSWELEHGDRVVEHMRPGEAWYLDTRKPHRAINGGAEERLHLVIDMASCAELRTLIAGFDEPEAGQMGLGL